MEYFSIQNNKSEMSLHKFLHYTSLYKIDIISNEWLKFSPAKDFCPPSFCPVINVIYWKTLDRKKEVIQFQGSTYKNCSIENIRSILQRILIMFQDITTFLPWFSYVTIIENLQFSIYSNFGRSNRKIKTNRSPLSSHATLWKSQDIPTFVS